MSFSGFMDVAVLAGIVLVALVTVGLIFSRLYKRASKEIAFVRTGLGGQKVIVNGGTLVFPVLHEIIPVNMNTMRLAVQRADDQALITRDRMRVDVLAEFYTRVQPVEESIATAAQTLGMRTMEPNALRELIEGKFVNALRAVAAEMAMEELQEQRVAFVQKVQSALSEDLIKNGLELETVSLTALNQTNREFFNPNNAFDAAGLTRLTEEIEAKRQRRNEIEQDTQVAIEQKNLEAERKRYEINRDMEYARLEQEREVEVRRAAQAASVAAEQAAKRREAEEAQITAERNIKLARIQADRNTEEERIAKERDLKELDILREKSVESAEVERSKTIELANQDRSIAVAEKSRAKSEAEANAAKAQAGAVKAEEEVETVRQAERAERDKIVRLIEARQAAETEAIRVTVAAEAEKQAAEDESESIRILAEAEASKNRIVAAGEADAEKSRVAAAELRYAVEAAGRRALNQAENELDSAIVDMKVRLSVIEHLKDIIHESVKPLENIDAIKIVQVDGLTGSGSAGPDGGKIEPAGGGNLAEQVVASALRYRAQAPIIDALMKDVGLSGGDLEGLAGVLQSPTAKVSDIGVPTTANAPKEKDPTLE